MPDIFYNEIKQDEILPSVSENQTISHPTILGQKAHETQTDYSNPRQTLVRVTEGNDIQKAIDAVRESGGGKVLLAPGTYVLNSSLTMYSNVSLVGYDKLTVIDFNGGAYTINFIGTNVYTAGSITVSNDDQTVTGLNTLWLSAAIASADIKRILIQGIWYNIQSINTDTSLTLSIPYSGINASYGNYVLSSYIALGGISDVIIQNTSTYGISVQYASTLVFDNIEFHDASATAKGFEILDSSDITLNNVSFKGVSRSMTIQRSSLIKGKNFFIQNDIDLTASIYIYDCDRSHSIFENVVNFNPTADAFQIEGCSFITIKNGGVIEGGGIGIELKNTCDNIHISEVAFENCAGNGVKFTASIFASHINSCSFEGGGDYAINIDGLSNGYNVLIGNYFSGNINGSILDSGIGTIIRSPANLQFLGGEKQSYLVSNNSGAPRVIGEVVIMDPGGDILNGFTTTTTLGDPKVLGVVAEDTADLAAGLIQTLGFLTTLKVNGTSAISVGNLLSTFSTAGIAKKAIAGEVAFAIACEGYGVADSSGIIDAILITPRQL